MRNGLLTILAALGCVLCVESTAEAQRTQSNTSSGLFGSRSMGGSISGLSRGGGGGSMTGAGIGGGNTLAGGTAGSDGQLTGNERFVRGNRRQGDFVGADTGDLQNFVGALAGGGGAGSRGALAGLANRGAADQRGANRGGQGGDFNGGRGDFGGQRASRPVRRTHQVAFDYSRPQPSTLGQSLTARLTRSTRLALLPGTTVEVRDRTAYLRGTAASAHDRDLAEQLLLLEPGISQVVNELTVADAEEAADEPASSS